MRSLLKGLAVLVLAAAACGEKSPSHAPDDSGMTGPDGETVPGESEPSGADPAPADPVPVEPPVEPPPRYQPAFFDLNHILSTGQSLSLGAWGVPALSTSQPYENKMFNTRESAGGTELTSFVPLVEKDKESMSTSMATLITSLAETEKLVGNAAPRNTHRLLVSLHGIGGIAYDGLKKGTGAFANALAQVTAGKELSTAAGMSYVVRAVTNVHGESDHMLGNTTYEQDLVEWQKDYETDVTAITGQSEPIPMFHTQMSSWTSLKRQGASDKSSTSAIPVAQLAASVNSKGKIVLVGPKYFLPYVVDGVHLTSTGYRQMGEYYAKVYRHVVLEGKAWEPLRPKSITRTGNVIRVVFHVPSPPLVFDTTLVAAAANQGFEYFDDSGAPPAITSVSLDAADAVKIELTHEPSGANQRLRYAYTGKPGAEAGPTDGPRGNLRDTDTTRSMNHDPLYNWAVHFDEPIP